MKGNVAWLFAGTLFILFFSACIKDTDFNETIQLTPVVELNLIHFNLDAGEFYDAATATPILTVRDTTELRFLEESTIQESVIKAEFYYKFTNSISRDFLIDFQFLNDVNDTTYTTQALVSEGSMVSPVISEHFDTLEGDQLLQLFEASKLVLNVTISSSDETVVGNLNMQSKTTYYLEF